MGIYDRDYNRYEHQPQMRFTMPRITPVVKWLLIINFAIFFLQTFFPLLGQSIHQWFSVFPYSYLGIFEVWRYISYQFLHGGIGHIFANMLGLFFFGPLLERQWGSQRFIKFYLICGLTGGVLFALLVALGILPVGALIGASGAVYGVLAAVAALYPNLRVYVYGIFPIPLYLLIIVIVIFSSFGFIAGNNQGGDAAHLAGLATGYILVMWPGISAKMKIKATKGAWEKRQQNELHFHEEVNRILDKVNREGISSLTRQEKNTLKKATEREQKK